MSISDQITRLQNAKASIKTSIENKGVTVPDDAKLDAFPALIDDIQAGGSGETHTNPDFYELRTQNGTNFDSLFRGYNGPVIDVSKWDTSNFTNAGYLFLSCSKLVSLDLSNWDTSNLTYAISLFHSCSSLVSLDLSNFDMSKATYYNYMFAGCTSLSTIKCKQAFKDWCITHQDDIYLPDAMREGGSGTWEIIG